jgi:diketogulonate reductase-like aldo/keto reductase
MMRAVLYLALLAAVAHGSVLTLHSVHSGDPHCDQLTVTDSSSTWWKDNSWRYKAWAHGSCPKRFNYLNEINKVTEAVEERMLGIDSNPALGGVPTIQIAPKVFLPLVGLGTWQYNDTRTEAAVTKALSVGYRAIDTAHDYANQAGVGRALRASGLDRSSYFVTTKLEGGLSFNETISRHEINLKELKLDYVDLLLVHFPTTMAPPIVGNASARQQQWLAMEALHAKGLTRAIGTSHFCRRQMEDILKIAKVRPAVNQVEFHVGMGSSGPNATDDRSFMEAHGITFQSFSPLCGPCSPPDNKELISGKLVAGIGSTSAKSGAQVSLRWQVQQGIPVIPKTDNLAHLKENIDLFDWALSHSAMKELTETTVPAAAGGGGDGTSGDCPLP